MRIFGANARRGWQLKCRRWKVWGGSLANARMLEDAEVDRFLVWPNTPGDCMLCFYIDPADKVRLDERSLAETRDMYHDCSSPCYVSRAAPCPP